MKQNDEKAPHENSIVMAGCRQSLWTVRYDDVPADDSALLRAFLPARTHWFICCSADTGLLRSIIQSEKGLFNTPEQAQMCQSRCLIFVSTAFSFDWEANAKQTIFGYYLVPAESTGDSSSCRRESIMDRSSVIEACNASSRCFMTSG
eukprot:m.35473 g.35473  ORF g.35473 m.35473 type:complete len:148 (-) comp11147_c0_seq2:575-1018(-)